MYRNVNNDHISGTFQCRLINNNDSIQQRQQRKRLLLVCIVFLLDVIHRLSGVVDAYSSASRCFRNSNRRTTFLHLHPSPNPFLCTKRQQRKQQRPIMTTSTANNQRWWFHCRRASNNHNISVLRSNMPNNEGTFLYTSREEEEDVAYDNPMQRRPRRQQTQQQDQQPRVSNEYSSDEAPQQQEQRQRNSRNDMRRKRTPVDNERNSENNMNAKDDFRDDPYNYYNTDTMNGNVQQRQQQRPSSRYFNQDSNDNNKYYSDNMNDYDDNDDDSDDEYFYDNKNNQGNNYNANKNQLLWERCTTVNSGTVHVVLPPPDVTIPSCIIHFMGGTFFGSTPTLWYRTLLEDIVYNTNAAIIVSTIPVTLLTSPLNHIDLSQQCQIQFKTAYRTILMDEYSDSDLSNVPVCGMGHSLGARLLTVLTTLQSGSSKSSSSIPSYKSFILISFTNYGAGSGIPGLYQLTKQSKLLQQKQVISNAASIGQQQQIQQQARRRRTQRPNRRRRNSNNYDNIDNYDDDDDDYEDDDDDGDNILLELQDILRQSKLAIQNALTPSPEELEFFPTPTQLWNAIINDQRYRVTQTLLVQFDNDPIDQSSKLAYELLRFTNNNSTSNDTNSEFTNQKQENGTPITRQQHPNIDVKFARIRGTHLTPVSLLPQKQQKQSRYYDDDNNNSYYSSMNQQVGNLFQRIVSNAASSTMGAASNKKKMEERQNQYIELRQTISRYITDVVLRKE